MADSLASRGIIQPLTVVTREAFLAAHPNHASDLASANYVVVDGNRRLAGAKLAGLDDAPVHVDDTLAQDADTLLETALTAAVQHEDLEPLDEAKALERLVEVHGSQRAVARALGKSSGWITQRLALLKLTPELKKALEDKTLPVKVARTVGQLPEQQQQSAADEALAQRAKQKSESARKPRSALSTPTASTASVPQSNAASPPDGMAPEEDLATLAADLKRRLTPQQTRNLLSYSSADGCYPVSTELRAHRRGCSRVPGYCPVSPKVGQSHRTLTTRLFVSSNFDRHRARADGPRARPARTATGLAMRSWAAGSKAVKHR